MRWNGLLLVRFGCQLIVVRLCTAFCLSCSLLCLLGARWCGVRAYDVDCRRQLRPGDCQGSITEEIPTSNI
ncbi:hypothetical protein SAICODRAFT_166751 [Saitoella complicata NRRL Y-17804]|uniref:uncharacterized protein n=1 Tax=Saitoella complicata (strain BCRC 22490 / CBS 7301 / JCM 7358 / NBRC 10748 / NRRL Y-17804) TaxID=698492 RepID=UPI000866B361|nr:uncharacterized protein SAICODRAFT_166751 [Saitoella complicata NRRL Y-17804]ODQ50669.1 hypothetical protein SAICODRAFT_166751 [Saitoella complicata NRRL Y-17804]